jgi:oligopeptidase B
MLGFNGRSAGGLLMGAVLTQRPDLCEVLWAGVPFVDALNTMSDPSITYVVYEYSEWGNPLANRLFYESTASNFPSVCVLLFSDDAIYMTSQHLWPLCSASGSLTMFSADMLSYDPYWNVRPVAYPNVLVQTGLADLLVNYWEPAKLVAKLRATRTNHGTLQSLCAVIFIV